MLKWLTFPGRFLSSLIPFILYSAGEVEGGKGVGHFSFASDENFFHALHAGEGTASL